MDKFDEIRLNRVFWISHLNEQKIIDASVFFDEYIESLTPYIKNRKYNKQALNEIYFSTKIFVSKMHELAKKYISDKNWAKALICHTVIFQYERSNFDYLREYLTCLENNKQYDLQFIIMNYMKEKFADYSKTYNILAPLYEKLGNPKEAVMAYKKYIELKGKNNLTAEEYNNMGHYYHELYRNDFTPGAEKYEKAALKNFIIAADMKPGVKLFNKNVTVTSLDNYKIYCKYYKRITDLGLATDVDRFDYSAASLKNQNFEDWHKYFDCRFTREVDPTKYPKMNKPQWNGETDLSTKTLLIHFEQGYGDTFLSWGYVQRLVPLAMHIIFVVPDSIVSLIRNNPWNIEVISKSDFDSQGAKFDYHLPAMSIMTALKLTRENISTGGYYITPPQSLINIFKEKYFNQNTCKLRIGISFRGKNSSYSNNTRNIPLEYLQSLDNIKGIELYSLQKDADINDFKDFKHNPVIDIQRDFKDFSYTAAAISGLDLILTTDNCIMNLAGAMGLKTFALFNRYNEYRYFDLTGKDIIYYPTVKPFVNDIQHNWTYSVNLAVSEIKKLLQEG